MDELKKAIEKFRKKRLAVYRADNNQLMRDTKAASRATKDHIGRWLLELLQNSDDAKASIISINVSCSAIYVADKGKGLIPSAVEAISGTDFSDKLTGTIGRKGIGFKAVYTVSQNPQVFSRNGEGLEFHKKKAEDWLQENKLTIEKGVPYQWLPFFISRNEEEKGDDILRKLHHFSTIVKLPSVSTTDSLNEFPPHGLLPFRHVRKLEVWRDEKPHFTLEVTMADNGSLVVHDSRKDRCVTWYVHKKSEVPPDEILNTLDEDESRRVADEGVSFLVGVPLDQQGSVSSLEEYPPVHVFYPAEKDLAPVRVLLHAEFMVKSDRTALIPIEEGGFNDWVADQLASFFVESVDGAYSPDDPAAYLRLLVPLAERENHPVADNLWKRIDEHAKEHLRLPDVNGNLRLSFADARLLRVSVEIDTARLIIEATTNGADLLHAALDDDSEAKKALTALECHSIGDDDLLNIMKDTAQQKVDDHDWIWACWEWVAAWVAAKPYGDEHKQRLERAKGLPLVSTGGTLHPMNLLDKKIITWRTKEATSDIPDWLPICFVDDWFRNKLRDCSEDDDPVGKLVGELGIQKPTGDVLLKALEKAIRQYWNNPDDSYGRFIELLLANDWHEEFDPPKGLQRCPISAEIEGEPTNRWVEAGHAYFGAEWSETDIAELYEGVQGVAWALVTEGNEEKYRAILLWIGVVPYPRLVQDGRNHLDEYQRLQKLLKADSYPPYSPPKPLFLDRLHTDSLSTPQTTILLQILANNWSNYFCKHFEIDVKCQGPRGGWRHPQSVPALWWEEIKTKLNPSLVSNHAKVECLENCWLPEKETRKAISDLLPIIDVDKFGERKQEVGRWLRNVVHVRTRLEQIKPDEWRTILSERIPSIVTEEKANADEKMRDRVKRWYEACLDSLEDQEGVSDGILANVPLLCRKSSDWKYIKDETRWLADNNEAADAFREDIWQITLPERFRNLAKKYLGIKLISAFVRTEAQAGEVCSDDDGLQTTLEQTLPYVFVWRLSKSKQDKDKLRDDLRNLSVCVVSELRAILTIEGVGSKEVERQHTVEDRRLLVSAGEGSRQSYMAEVLTTFLKVKSDAEFFENLFRCKNDDERKRKLLSKDVPPEEIDRFLREFREEIAEIQPSYEQVKQEIDTEATEQSTMPVSGGSSEQTQELNGTLTGVAEPPYRCGWKVEVMPPNHPGFDLKATKGTAVLLIEVKGHRATSSVADLTVRQLNEYYKYRESKKWQLWNVENLAEDTGPVRISPYVFIPDEALRDKQFSVDLHKCETIPPEEL